MIVAWHEVPGTAFYREKRPVGYGMNRSRGARLRESDRALRDGSFGVALFQALRARLRSDRHSVTGDKAPSASGQQIFQIFLSLALFNPRQSMPALRANSGSEFSPLINHPNFRSSSLTTDNWQLPYSSLQWRMIFPDWPLFMS